MADLLTPDQRKVLQAIAASKESWYSLDGRVEEGVQALDVPRQVEGRLTPQDKDWFKGALAPTMSVAKIAELRQSLATGLEEIRISRRDPSSG